MMNTMNIKRSIVLLLVVLLASILLIQFVSCEETTTTEPAAAVVETEQQQQQQQQQQQEEPAVVVETEKVPLDENEQPVEEKYRQFINPNAADKPFHDQKDMARIETCIGPCLNSYPDAKEFIMKHSFTYSGLQTMFIGEYPQLIIYDANGLTTQKYDLREMTIQQIEQLLANHGLSKVKPE